ncbi:type I restriction enzyme HsdR N-terminal domain-containing protein [Chryseobacterium sp. CFBP8996]|uniref:type I restriction enzyme HsdR N-terminal domain-containing protein n=1 Tax=Chryseobacterium sp. CFBP8996 TaxID=3096529 RepID=UPI002A6B2F46|nr:type I restriction enzyme HsdR N-terminal domain-containing protein [Chryseobacterium sp. CFBP8996]MDY0932110.1 type I restriction enzyme HsdR N-terminal domain-containing protein [Chryseobacterium sp. CFBP8996]
MINNEATLEARIDCVLASVFPTFKTVNVQHQKSFSIKFGHHNVKVDLEEPSNYPSRAIFDILLTIENKNVILLELKKEGLNLTNDDILQGLSYARLIDNMPPLTLISNGKDNWFYNTYTKEKIETTNVDLAIIQKLTDNSFQLAINDFKDAINLLLKQRTGTIFKSNQSNN